MTAKKGPRKRKAKKGSPSPGRNATKRPTRKKAGRAARPKKKASRKAEPKIPSALPPVEAHEPNTKWSDEQVRAALVAYVQQGSVGGASRVCGIPSQRISEMTRDPAWGPELGKIRLAHARAIRDRYVSMGLGFAEALDEALTMTRHSLRPQPLVDKQGKAVLGKDKHPVLLPPDPFALGRLGTFLVQGLTAVDRIALREKLTAALEEGSASLLTDRELDLELKEALLDPELAGAVRDMGLNMGAEELARLLGKVASHEADPDLDEEAPPPMAPE